MATTTTKLGLTKPAYTDIVDVADLNDNADKLDAAAGFTIVANEAARPASPWTGQVIYQTDVSSSFMWDGSAWQAAGGGGGGGLTISATAPASPAEGDLWWDSDDGKMYVYYNDGTSSQWVDAAGPSVAVQSTAPTGYEGQLWLDDTDGSMYVYYTDPGAGSSSWIGAVSRSGGILQVVSTAKKDTFSTTSTTPVDITGLSATITPRSTSSKILVLVQLSMSVSDGADHAVFAQLSGGNASNYIGDAGQASQPRAVMGTLNNTSSFIWRVSSLAYPMNFLDSPNTTSSVTYSAQLFAKSGSTGYVNRSGTDTNFTHYARTASSITLIEVAG